MKPSGVVILGGASRQAVAQQLHRQLKATGRAACWTGAGAGGFGERVGPDVGHDGKAPPARPTSAKTTALAGKSSTEARAAPSQSISLDRSQAWTHVVDIPSGAGGREFVGVLSLASEQQAEVCVKLARHGSGPWEVDERTLALAPGKPQWIALRKRFVGDHKQIRLQVNVLDLKGPPVELTVEEALVIESPKSCARSEGGGAHLKAAQAAALGGHWATSLSVYLYCQLNPENAKLGIYRRGADMALQRLGVAGKESRGKMLDLLLETSA
jgi:hypothetical protein